MREEVKVDERCHYPKVKISRKVLVRELQIGKSAGDVASYCRVEKPRKERHRAEHKECVPNARISPGTNGRMRLKEFHAGCEQVEEYDDRKLSQPLESKQQCTYLKTDCCKKNEIVPANERNGDNLGNEKYREEECAKVTRF